MPWFSRTPDAQREELDLREAIRLDAQNPVPRNRFGDWLVSQGRLAEAIREYKRAGKAYLSREQYRRAMAVLRKAFRLDPADPPLADLLVHNASGIISSAPGIGGSGGIR